MRVYTLFFLTLLPYIAVGTEVVYMEYDDNNEVKVYEYVDEGCSCVCKGY